MCEEEKRNFKSVSCYSPYHLVYILSTRCHTHDQAVHLHICILWSDLFHACTVGSFVQELVLLSGIKVWFMDGPCTMTMGLVPYTLSTCCFIHVCSYLPFLIKVVTLYRPKMLRLIMCQGIHVCVYDKWDPYTFNHLKWTGTRVAVPGRNQTFRCVFWPCYCIRSAVVQYFR